VIAREDTPGEKRLVAYLILNQREQELQVTELRAFLRELLPDYMIPSAFVFLEEYPLTPNKKIDRKALPAPDQTRPELIQQYMAPRDEIEEATANAFASVLKVERVGIYDNFFELGGHSLLATQVISRIRNDLNIDLPLRALFESPTVAELALVILKKKIELVNDDKISKLLTDLEGLSAEEVDALLGTDDAE
jgi:acyl carrier protein